MSVVVIDEEKFGPLSEAEQMGIAKLLLGRKPLPDDCIIYVATGSVIATQEKADAAQDLEAKDKGKA